MAEVVDSIIAELVIRGIDEYEARFARMKRAHEGALPSLKAIGEQSVSIEQAAERYKAGSDRIAQSEEQTTAKVARSRKTRSDAVKQADAADVTSAKAAADAKVAAEEAAQARISAMVDRGLAERAAKMKAADPRTSRIGATVPREGTGQASIPLAVLGGEDVATETEIDRLKVDQITHQAALNTLRGAEKREAQDNLATMRLERQLRAENVAEEEILLRVETLRGAQAARNVAQQNAANRRSEARGGEQFARGLGAYQATGGATAIAGLGVAAAAAGTVAAVDSSLSLAKEISNAASATGTTTQQIQVYQAAARQAGATNEQLASSFGHLNDYLGKAQLGDEKAKAAFDALNIGITEATKAGDILPRLAESLSSIKDPSERAAVGVLLFGEEYRKLDAILGQGPDKVDALATSMEKAGTILSPQDIATLKSADETLGELKNKLEVDLAKVVSGNTDAILGLANACAALADKLLGVVGAIGQFAHSDLGGSVISGALNAIPGLGVARLYAGKIDEINAELAAQQPQRAPGKAVNKSKIAGPPRTTADQAKIKKLFAPKPPKGPKGPKDKTPDQLAAEQAERDRQYYDRLSGLRETQLRAQEQLTGSIQMQAGIEQDLAVDALKKQLVDIELTRQRNVDKINAEHASAAEKASAIKLENAHADELAAQAAATSATQQRVIALDTDRKTIEAQTQHDLTLLSINAEMLSTQASLATTRKERLALELQALENQRQTEKKTLEGQLKVLATDDPRRRDVQASLDALPAKYAGKAEQTRQGNLSPLDAYRKQLQGAVGDNAALRDSFEQVAVNGIGRVEDQIASTISKLTGLKGAFGELVSSVLADLAKIELEKGILSLLGSVRGGGFIGGSPIGEPDGIGSASDALSGLSLPGFASGGSATIGGRSGVDQNVLSINGQPALRVGKGEQLTVSPQNQVISPNNSAVAPPGGGGTITVHVEANDYFDARVAHVSGPIAQQTSVRVVKAAAPTIIGQAVNAAPGRVSQVQTLGS